MLTVKMPLTRLTSVHSVMQQFGRQATRSQKHSRMVLERPTLMMLALQPD